MTGRGNCAGTTEGDLVGFLTDRNGEASRAALAGAEVGDVSLGTCVGFTVSGTPGIALAGLEDGVSCRRRLGLGWARMALILSRRTCPLLGVLSLVSIVTALSAVAGA